MGQRNLVPRPPEPWRGSSMDEMTGVELPSVGEPGVGEMLVDRYELRRRTRVGPLGTRWQAWDHQLAREVTVKLVFAHAVTDPVAREWFRRESLATARIHHPNVSGLYDAHATDQHVFIVLEHVEGIDLDALTGRRLDPEVVAALGCQVADGLDAAHAAGVVHRDIRPPNLLVATSGHVKITNFTVSKLKDMVEDDITVEPTLRELFGHVAPEQMIGEEPTAATDVYALGLTLWEALAGHLPFAPEPLPASAMRRVHEPLPPLDRPRGGPARDLVDAIERATQAAPGDRYGAASEMAEDLRSICGARPHAVTVRLLELARDA